MSKNTGKILAISVAEQRGTKKRNKSSALLVENFGIEGDAHAGDWHRQVSLLASESIDSMRSSGLEVGPGDFAENITTAGIDLGRLEVGDRLDLGNGVILEVTQIGKECHDRCAIFQMAGDCIMPREGIFARVVKGGLLRVGDPVKPVSANEAR